MWYSQCLPSLQRGICGAGWERDGMAAKVLLPGISVGFTLLPVPSGSGPQRCPSVQPLKAAVSDPQAAFPRGAWADEGGGCFPGFLTAVPSPTETPWAAVLPSLHEQDALHHHLLGKAVSSATCSHRGSSKAAPPAAQDSLSLVLLLSRVTSKAPFPIS